MNVHEDLSGSELNYGPAVPDLDGNNDAVARAVPRFALTGWRVPREAKDGVWIGIGPRIELNSFGRAGVGLAARTTVHVCKNAGAIVATLSELHKAAGRLLKQFEGGMGGVSVTS